MQGLDFLYKNKKKIKCFKKIFVSLDFLLKISYHVSHSEWGVKNMKNYCRLIGNLQIVVFTIFLSMPHSHVKKESYRKIQKFYA
jgi:hypothetical protein